MSNQVEPFQVPVFPGEFMGFCQELGPPHPSYPSPLCVPKASAIARIIRSFAGGRHGGERRSDERCAGTKVAVSPSLSFLPSSTCDLSCIHPFKDSDRCVRNFPRNQQRGAGERF